MSDKNGQCPICQATPVPKYAPFCSKRCADIDLNRWLSGGYAVPSVEDESIAANDDDLAERLT